MVKTARCEHQIFGLDKLLYALRKRALTIPGAYILGQTSDVLEIRRILCERRIVSTDAKIVQ